MAARVVAPTRSGVETRERLRKLIRSIERDEPRRRSAASSVAPRPAASALPPGWERRQVDAGSYSFRVVCYPLGEPVGEQPLDELRYATGAALDVMAPDAGVAGVRLDELLFLDIETTGLGGAGAIAFMVATGRVEGSALLVRQYLAQSPAEEAALLDALIADAGLAPGTAGGGPVLVTYNGRAFDAPVLDGRATMHRRRAGFDALRHIDMLMPARRIYRGWLPSCRLADVEARVLRLTRPAGEVEGAETPAWYFRYLRSGDPRFVEPLAAHNALDVASLAALTARVAALVTGARVPEGAEALGLARLLIPGSPGRARTQLRSAIATLPAGAMRDEALMQLASLHKGAGRSDLAAPLWDGVASRRQRGALRAFEELAKYYEHRLRDFQRAADVVVHALALVERVLAPRDPAQALRRERALRHRLARLHSRAARAQDAGAEIASD